MSRSQRVNRGFHRLGLVLAGASILIGGLTAISDGIANLWAGLIFALVLYAFFRAVGWIIAGFLSDGS